MSESLLSSLVQAKPLVSSPLNVQEGGGHYKDCPIQPIEYCMVNKLDHCQSNVIKYVTRFRDKGGLEDLLKARHYIDLLIHFEYGNEKTEEKSDSERVGGSKIPPASYHGQTK